MVKHPNENETHVYKIFVNGTFLNQTGVYDFAYNRGLGIALFLKLDFENTKSPLITDKWKGENGMIIITKELKK